MRSIPCVLILFCCVSLAVMPSAAHTQTDTEAPQHPKKTLHTPSIEETLKKKDGAETGFGGHFCCKDFTGINRALCAAASDIESEEVARLIQAGADIEARSQGRFTKGMTMLVIGVSYKWDVKALELLIRSGADVNAKDDRGNSALIYAADGQPGVQRTVIELLLKSGADVNSRGERGMTPLMRAAMQDDVESIGLLLQAGAQLHARDRFGWTALMHAVRKKQGHPRIVAALLKAGAWVNAMHKHGGTPLSIASYNGHTKAVELLLHTGAAVNTKDRAGWTPLICAAYGGHTQVVKLLIAAGADLSATDSMERTALAVAMHYEHEKTAKLLREAGAK